MGVYIPSLKMPQTCEDCNLESYCSLWVDARRMSGSWEKGVEATIRHPDCPLVEVKPHGRLIDADELTNNILLRTYIRFHTGETPPSEWMILGQHIIDAPTIIEAEVEE